MVNTDNFNKKFSELCSVMSNDVYKYYFYGSDEEMDIVIDFLNHGEIEYDIKSGEVSIRLVKHYQKYDSDRYDWDEKLDNLRKGAIIEVLTYSESSKMTSIIKDRKLLIKIICINHLLISLLTWSPHAIRTFKLGIHILILKDNIKQPKITYKLFFLYLSGILCFP